MPEDATETEPQKSFEERLKENTEKLAETLHLQRVLLDLYPSLNPTQQKAIEAVCYL